MFHQLVSRNPDLQRLVDRGYAVAVDSNHLVVRDIPYLDAELRLRVGAIVTSLTFIDQERVQQTDHQIYFAGGVPHGVDGRPIPNLGGGPTQLPLSRACEDVVVERSFSNKPVKTGCFADFFEKIESYVTIISGPAMERDGATPYTYRAVDSVVGESVFCLNDTLTSRANIGDLAARFADDIVAIIGLGGTGAYLLDFLSRTPVKEIRAFDHDLYQVHNAFRSPGSVDEKEFGRPKTEVYKERYERIRTGLRFERKFIDATCEPDVEGVTFAFVCVDKGTSRAGIFDLLLAKRIPFIDVGMGLNRKHGALTGLIRTTHYSAETGLSVRAEGLAELAADPDDLYRSNIQIGELNALNASLAVIYYKQLRGFYHSASTDYHFLFDVADRRVVMHGAADAV